MVKKSLQYASETSSLDWCQYIICNVIDNANETMESCWNMAFSDLLALKEYYDIKSFIEAINHKTQADEIQRLNKQK